MAYYGFGEYVSVGEKKRRAERQIAKLSKKRKIKPVTVAGRSLARTWWGKAWNKNLERYADFANRVGRGRSYLRHSCVIHLEVEPGKVTAIVNGSDLYNITIDIDPVDEKTWEEIRKICSGKLDSIADLVDGKFPKQLEELFMKKGSGLFPSPDEISFDCDCPDWASMCKHIAACLYGIGSRLDDDPTLLFVLRKIDPAELISQTINKTTEDLLEKAENQGGRVLADSDLGDVFGIDMDDLDSLEVPSLPAPGKKASSSRKSAKKSPAKKNATPKKSGKGSLLDQVTAAVYSYKRGANVSQLVKKTGLSKTQVRNALSRALNKGIIQSKAGTYRKADH